MNQKYINIILAALIVVIGVAIIFGGKTERVIERVTERLSGQTDFDILAVVQEFIFKQRSNTYVDTVTREISGVLAPTEHSEAWYNDSPNQVYVPYARLSLASGDSASSTVRVSVFATTTETLPGNIGLGSLTVLSALAAQADTGAWLFQNWSIATSTAGATTTSSTVGSLVSAFNPGGIVIPGQGYLHIIKQLESDCDGAGGCSLFATSSDLGLNIHYNFPTVGTTTSRN